MSLGDLAKLHANVALARIRAHRLREHANADLELRHHLIEHRLHNRGHARFWSLVRPDRILPPITRRAAVTTSLKADELGVDMITCESAQNPEFGRLINWGVAPFQTHTEGGALANR